MAVPRSDNRSLASYIGEIAHLFAQGAMSSGEAAALRRMDVNQPVPLAFYRLGVRHLPPSWDRDAESVRDWVTIVAGIAILAPSGYRPDIGLGRALARSGFSEARMERLLASDGDTLRILALRAARLMAAKTQPCNWSEAGQLLLAREATRLEVVRSHVARDFYVTLDIEDR